MTRYAKGRKPSSAPPNYPRKPGTIRLSRDLTSAIRWILNRPRIIRILMVSLIALAVTLAAFPIVDELYVRLLFNEATIILPSFVSAGLGIIAYILGWRLIVGTIGEDRPVRPAVFWYIVVGILAILLVIALLLQGYSIATAPDA